MVLVNGPAGLDAQSLHDMRERADVWLADRSYTAELARDVVALTDEVERLVGCVAEAERRTLEVSRERQDRTAELVRSLYEMADGNVSEGFAFAAAGCEQAERMAEDAEAERDVARAALADARDALERIAAEYEGGPASPLTAYFEAAAVAREVLVRLNQEPK